MDPHFAVSFFGALFAIMNPVSNLPVFLSVTEGASPPQQRAIALKVALYSGVMGAIFALAGSQALAFFGVSVDDFRVAGGLVVLLLGLNMLSGADSSAHHGTKAEQDAYAPDETVAFYPLTFPILVGPGTITTLILFAQQAQSPADKIAFAAVFGAVVVLLAVVFWFAASLGQRLSVTARAIMTRLMGMILAAIAVDMLAKGLTALFPGLAG